jgi:hypothetical protein
VVLLPSTVTYLINPNPVKVVRKEESTGSEPRAVSPEPRHGLVATCSSSLSKSCDALAVSDRSTFGFKSCFIYSLCPPTWNGGRFSMT